MTRKSPTEMHRGAQLHSILVVHLMYSFKKMVAHDQAYRVNFQNIGGARAPGA